MNHGWTQMDTDLIHKKESELIIGCAFRVLNEIGHGFHEKPYENAMVVEMGLAGIPYAQQPRFPMTYKGVQISEFVPDLIAYEKIIVDAKVIDRITQVEIGQMINYLKITRLKLGLILNFKQPTLEFRRVVPFTQNFIRRSSPF